MNTEWEQDMYDDGSPSRSLSPDGVRLNSDECAKLLTLLSDIKKTANFGSFQDIMEKRVEDFYRKVDLVSRGFNENDKEKSNGI